MKLLADENVDRPIVARLRADGHAVVYVLELAPSIPDPEVASLAARESALLLTADKDFGELMFRQHRVAQGVVLIRLSGLSAGLKAALVASALREHAAELPGNFAVITPGGVRIRKRAVPWPAARRRNSRQVRQERQVRQGRLPLLQTANWELETRGQRPRLHSGI